MSPVIHEGKRVVTPLKKTSSGTPYITVAYPVSDHSGAVVGAVVSHVNPQLLVSTFDSSALPEGSVVTLTEMDGRVIARNLEPERFIGQLLDEGWITDAPEPPRQLEGADGVRRLYSEAIVEGGPWLVSVGIPMSFAYERAFSLWTRSATILAIGLSGWLVVVLVFSRRLTRSVAHLEGAAQRIASGDFSPIEAQPMPTREFERAAAGVQPDADAVQRNPRRARFADGRAAPHARGAAVAATAGDPPGTARGRRPAGVRRRARDQQPAAGDPRLRRAAPDAGERARRGQERSHPDSEGERPRLRHHPEPRVVRAAADRAKPRVSVSAMSSPRSPSSVSAGSSRRTSSFASRISRSSRCWR